MSSRQRYSSRNTKSNIPYSWILLALAALWIAVASFVQKSPVSIFKDAYNNLVGDSTNITKTHNEWLVVAAQKDSSITSLETKLDKCKNASPYLNGTIDINDDFVNMRSEANLSSSILTKVPNGAGVVILYFDTKEYFWDGKMGKWGKVKYADLEGWIWGNYIKVIDPDSQ